MAARARAHAAGPGARRALPAGGLGGGARRVGPAGGRARRAAGPAAVRRRAPLAATIPGEAELLDVWLTERLPRWRVRDALLATLPPDHDLVDVYDVWLGRGAAARQGRRRRSTAPVALVAVASIPAALRLAAAALLAEPALPRERRKGDGHDRLRPAPVHRGDRGGRGRCLVDGRGRRGRPAGWRRRGWSRDDRGPDDAPPRPRAGRRPSRRAARGPVRTSWVWRSSRVPWSASAWSSRPGRARAARAAPRGLRLPVRR